MTLRFRFDTKGRAFCARPGCGEPMGTIVGARRVIAWGSPEVLGFTLPRRYVETAGGWEAHRQHRKPVSDGLPTEWRVVPLPAIVRCFRCSTPHVVDDGDLRPA